MQIKLMGSKKTFEVLETGIKTPFMKVTDALYAGEVGYVIAGIKNIKDAHVGDTITDVHSPAVEALPGYKPIKPMGVLRSLSY